MTISKIPTTPIPPALCSRQGTVTASIRRRMDAYREVLGDGEMSVIGLLGLGGVAGAAGTAAVTGDF
jgi:hypothetical protein